MNKLISPKKKLNGALRLAGDKSISHRALMIAAMAEGVSEIENLSPAADVNSTISCLQKLGTKFKFKNGVTRVFGNGLLSFSPAREILDVGNSGTTIRLLSGLLAGQPFETTVTGDDSVRRRPMARIVQPLRQMGARIDAKSDTDPLRGKDEFAPLTIRGGKLSPISYSLPVASAQVKSCLLLAGLFAEGETRVIESSPTRDHTERLLQNFGATIGKDGGAISVAGPAQLTAQHVYVPGDLSSAAFLIAAAILTGGSRITIENVGVNPTRRAFLALLMEMGAEIDLINFANINNEFFADVSAKSSALRAIKIGGELVPQIIDEIPILAVLATQAEGVTEISGADELRVKESDRLTALHSNLQKMGAAVWEKEDGLIIHGPSRLRGAAIDSFHDHRIAMAFAVAALIAEGETVIQNAQCVDSSFPNFFETLEELASG
jgi:3-phosphoshikimate 1-carboxyvinyltransferase